MSVGETNEIYYRVGDIYMVINIFMILALREARGI